LSFAGRLFCFVLWSERQKGDAHISGLNHFSSMDAHQIALFAQNLLTRPERLKQDSSQGQNRQKSFPRKNYILHQVVLLSA
jgi:hypothetical protein